MSDTGNGILRGFGGGRQMEADQSGPRSVRDRIRRSNESDQGGAGGAVSRSGYVHQQPAPPEEHAPVAPIPQPSIGEPPVQRAAPPKPQEQAPQAPAARLGEAPPRPSQHAPKPQPAPEPKPKKEEDPVSDNAMQPIGVVLEIAGSGSMIAIDLQRLTECSQDNDPAVAMAGQVGSQIKIRVGSSWLLASVRNQKQDRKAGTILANIDFLGEGIEVGGL